MSVLKSQDKTNNANLVVCWKNVSRLWQYPVLLASSFGRMQSFILLTRGKEQSYSSKPVVNRSNDPEYVTICCCIHKIKNIKNHTMKLPKWSNSYIICHILTHSLVVVLCFISWLQLLTRKEFCASAFQQKKCFPESWEHFDQPGKQSNKQLQ